jgi:hypothetical protein
MHRMDIDNFGWTLIIKDFEQSSPTKDKITRQIGFIPQYADNYGLEVIDLATSLEKATKLNPYYRPGCEKHCF